MRRARNLTAAILAGGALCASLVTAAPAADKASHKDWPKIDRLVIHRDDESSAISGRKGKHSEMLGGHGNDTITAGDIGDVIWGDYKSSGQPATQHDVLTGGAGKDHIYASHGTNIIVSNGGADQIHAHFGRGSITCTNAQPLVFLSHKSKRNYELHGCKRITFRSSL